ncbi:FAD-dependent monooxygenase [Streptomyces sp. NPDC050703]|uniref:FAD-dependent monooxygenase n=1 Tax=Streptomyces sp. NPDC050703 TaxID=3157218 RepID=UPI0034492DA7
MTALNSVKAAAAETADVLVVGAGPTGLALACDLARRGVRALVVERSGPPSPALPGSRGKGLQPRTMEVFDDLGVIDAFLAVGGGVPVGMIWRDGERQGEHHLADVPAVTPTAPHTGRVVPQWLTQQLLLDRLRELGGDVTYGTAVTELTQDTDGVTAALSTGSTVRAAYAVAADGGRSALRQALGITMTGETVDPRPALVADVRIPALDRDHWHMFPPAEEGGPFAALCPLPGTDVFQLAAQLPERAEADTSLDGVRAVVAARTHLAPEDVAEVRWVSAFRPRAALADRFREGRVFLAGDAAHVHSPAGGQGLNTSVQDAYNLGWKLGAVLRHGAPEALLDTYEEERLPNAAHMLGLSTRVHRGEARRGAATRQLGIGYRESSLAVDARTGLPEEALRAGDRAPDGPYGAGTLFDAFRGPHFTLLAVGVDGEPPRPAGDLVRVHRLPAYEPYGEGFFLIRPDGYVGWAGEDTAGLREYAETWLGARLPALDLKSA